MLEDVKNRFEDYEKRIAGLEKRIDDVKWYVSGFTGLFVVIFGLSSYLVNNNFNVEKKNVQDTLQELRNREKLEKPPQIELMDEEGASLAGQSVASHFEGDPGNLRLVIRLAMKNVGEASSGKLYVKVYTDDSIQLSDRATDEKDVYKYETIITPEQLSPNEIPGGNFSFNDEYHLGLTNSKPPDAGAHKALVKVFYGKGLVVQAKVMLLVPKK